jgi:thiol:disulfide interchange protein DsbD
MMDWIQLPYLSAGPDTKRKGHIGVFVTGLLSGLVVAPCASPVLFGLLLYVSTTRNVLLGGSMLFSFSIGMSTLLIVIGTFSGALKLLPRPGEWMVWVKRALALGLFILAQYYILKAGGSLL